MALKPDRIELQTDVSFFMNATATRGGVASVTVSGGSGAAMDDGDALVSYATTASGAKPVGVLLNDVVNLDLTRQHINWHKDEVQQGGKVTLLQVGQITTNMVDGTPGAGDVAYLAGTGYISATAPTDDNSELKQHQVGRFLSSKDADGYAKVAINLV